MAKQLNVEYKVTANTSEAKKAFESLQMSLSKVTSQAVQKQSYGQLTTDLKNASAAASELQIHLNSAFNTNTNKLDLSKFNASLKKSNTDLNSLATNLLKGGSQGQAAFMKLASSVASADRPIITMNSHVQGLLTSLKNTARWQLSSSALHSFMSAIQNAYHYAQSLNESLNNIRIVTGMNTDQMAEFAEAANKAAQALSTTTTSYTNAALIYYQQGIRDQQEIAERAEATIKLANVSATDAKTVSQWMTAIWNNFDDGSKSLEYFADVLTNLGANTASSSAEIATGLQKFSAIADTVGLSYEYAAASLATITATTRQSADVVGTALKTLFARIQDLEVGDTLEDGTTLGKYSKALESIGVSIKDANGEVKNMDVILDEMGNKWGSLSKDVQIAVAQTVAGTRQYTQLLALMDNWDIMKQNIALAEDAAGTLQKQQDIYEESWAASRKRVRAAMEAIYSDVVKDDFFISLNNGFASFLSTLDHVIDKMGGIQPILMGIASFFLSAFAPKISGAILGIRDTITQVFMSAKQQAIQQEQTFTNLTNAAKQVFGTSNGLSPTNEIRMKLFASEAEVKQKLALVTKDLTAQEAAQAEVLMNALATERESIELNLQYVDTIMQKNEALQNEMIFSASNTAAQENAIAIIQNKINVLNQEIAILQEENQETNLLLQELKAWEQAEAEMGNITENLTVLLTGLLENMSKDTEQMKNWKKATFDLTEAFNAFKITAQGISNIFQKSFKGTLEIENAKNSVKSLQQMLESVGLEEQALDKLFPQLGQAIKNALNAENASVLEGHLKEIAIQLGDMSIKGEQVSTLLNTVGGSGKQFEVLVQQLTAANLRIKELEGSMEKLLITSKSVNFNHFVTGLESVLKLASGMGQASMAIMSLKTLLSSFSTDVEMTWSERLMTFLMGASMLVPAVVGAFKNLNATLGISAAITEALTLIEQEKTIATTASIFIDDKAIQKDELAAAVKAKLITVEERDNLVKENKTRKTVQSMLATQMETNVEKSSTMVKKLHAAITATQTFWTNKSASAALKAAAAWGAAVLPILAITAGIVALVLVIKSIKKSIEELDPERPLKQAKAQVDLFTSALDKAKNAADALNQAFSEYDTAQEKLQNCTKGTQEWRDALIEANNATLDLIANYPELSEFVSKTSDGAWVIDKAEQQRLLEEANNQTESIRIGKQLANQQVSREENQLQKRNLWDDNKNIGDGSSVGNGYINFLVKKNEDRLANAKDNDEVKEIINEIFKNNDILKTKVDGTTNADVYAQNLIDSGLIDELRNLTTATEANTKSIEIENKLIADQALADNKQVQESKHADDIVKLASKSLPNLINQEQKQILNTLKNTGNTNEKNDIINKYLEANVSDKIKDSRIKGDYLEYKDENDTKWQKVELDTVASFTAAANSVSLLNDSVNDLISTFTALDEAMKNKNTNGGAEAINSFLTEGNFDAVSKGVLNDMTAELEGMDPKSYLKSVFNVKDDDELLEVAKQAGYLTVDAFVESFDERKADIDKAWDSLKGNAKHLEDLGFNAELLSLEAAQSLGQIFDKVDISPLADRLTSEGQTAKEVLANMLNEAVTEGLSNADENVKKAALNEIANLDFTSTMDGAAAIQEIITSLGGELDISTEKWQEFSIAMNIAMDNQATFEASIASLQELSMALEKIDFGTILNEEDYSKIIARFTNLADCFIDIGNSQYQFIGSQKDLDLKIAESAQSIIQNYQEMSTTVIAALQDISDAQGVAETDFFNNEGLLEEKSSDKHIYQEKRDELEALAASEHGQDMLVELNIDEETFNKAIDNAEKVDEMYTRVYNHISEYNHELSQQQYDMAAALAQNIEQLNMLYETTENGINDEAYNKRAGVFLGMAEDIQDVMYILDEFKGQLSDIPNGALDALAENFESCKNEVAEFQQAILSNDDTLIKSKELLLENAFAAAELAEEYDLATNSAEDLVKAFQEKNDALKNKGLTSDSEAAADAAQRYLDLNSAVEDLAKNYEDYNEVLQNIKKATSDEEKAYLAASGAGKELQKSLAKLIGTSEDFINTDLLAAIDPDLFAQAADGDEAAIERIRIAFIDLQAEINNLDSSELQEFKNTLAGLEEGAVLDLDTLPFLEHLIEARLAAGDSAEDIERLLSGFGIDCDIEPLVGSINNAIDVASQGSDKIVEAMAVDTEATTATAQTEGKEENVQWEEHHEITGIHHWHNTVSKDVNSDSVQIPLIYTDIKKTVVPHVAETPTQDEVPITAVRVKNLHKSAGGHVSATNKGKKKVSSSGSSGGSKPRGSKPRGSSGSKGDRGGSSAGSTEKAPTKTVHIRTDPRREVKYYQNNETALKKINHQYDLLEKAKNRAWGVNKLKLIEQETKLLKAEEAQLKKLAAEEAQVLKSRQNDLERGITYYTTKKDAAGNEYEIQQTTGPISGIQYDELGQITNQEEIQMAIEEKRNKIRTWWNSLTPTQQQTQEAKDYFDQQMERFDKAMEALEEYNAAEEKLLDTQSQIEDNITAQSAIIREGIETKIDLEITIRDADLSRLELAAEVLGDHLYQIPEVMNNLYSSTSPDNQVDNIFRGLNTYAEGWAEIQARADELSDADFIESTKAVMDGMISDIRQFLALNEEMWGYYAKTLDGAAEEIARITQQMDAQVKTIEHLRNVLKLMHKDTDYDSITKLIEAQEHMSMNRLKGLRDEYNMYKAEEEKALEFFNSHYANDPTSKVAQDYQEHVLDPIMKKTREAAAEMESLSENLLDLIDQKVEVLLEKVSKNTENLLTDKFGWDFLSTMMSNASNAADLFYTKTNQVYEATTLLNKITKEMDKTTNKSHKNKLKNLSDIVEVLRDQNELSKTDMEIAEARFAILQAEMALEDTQATKKIVRLQRDNEGNYGYVYTADQEEATAAEQDLLDKENDLYNIAKRHLEETTSAIVELDQSTHDQLLAIWSDYSLTAEEKQRRSTVIWTNYQRQLEQYVKQGNTAIQVLNETGIQGSVEVWNTGLFEMVSNTDASYSAMEEMILSIQQITADAESERQEVLGVSGDQLEDLSKKTEDLTLKNDILAASLQTDVIPRVADTIEAARDLTNEWAEQQTEIERLIQYYQQLIQEMTIAMGLRGGFNSSAALPSKSERDHSQTSAQIMDQTGKFGEQNANEMILRSPKGEENNYTTEQYFGPNGDILIAQLFAQRQKNKGYNQKSIADSWHHYYDYLQEGNWLVSQQGFSNIDDAVTYIMHNFGGITDEESVRKTLESETYWQQLGGKVLDTGGYTGEWGPEGRIAMLHEKELVLNKEDTANLLSAITIVKDLVSNIGNLKNLFYQNTLENLFSNAIANFQPFNVSADTEENKQNIVINADFPNATDRNEILAAFESLTNSTAQYLGQ